MKITYTFDEYHNIISHLIAYDAGSMRYIGESAGAIEAFTSTVKNINNEEFILEVPEEMMMQFIEFYGRRSVKAIPLIVKLADIVEPVVDAVKAILKVFDKSLLNDIKEFAKDSYDEYEDILLEHMDF